MWLVAIYCNAILRQLCSSKLELKTLEGETIFGVKPTVYV